MINDAETRHYIVLSTCSTQVNIVSIVMMNFNLSQHSIVLNQATTNQHTQNFAKSPNVSNVLRLPAISTLDQLDVQLDTFNFNPPHGILIVFTCHLYLGQKI